MKYLEQHCKTKIKRIQLSHCHIYSFRYEVGSIPSLLYIASGGSLDWALGEAGIPYSFGNILIKIFLQNSSTHWAQILCGTLLEPREGLWMLRSTNIFEIFYHISFININMY